jgi:DNA repair photolyase
MAPWLAFERHIFVKDNAAKVLRKTLRYGSDKHRALIQGDRIVIGTATDPYQPGERKFRITRSILETLAEHPDLAVTIITKSPLVSRDIDVLSRINRHSSLSIHMTITTIDRDLARRIEPRAPTPESRIRALARVREAGIDIGVNVMPVMPGITDNPSQLEELVKRVAAAGATHVNSCALRLQSTARKRYLPWIAAEFPHLAERYHNTYAHDYNAGEKYREGLAKFFDKLCRKYKVRGWSYDPASTSDEETESPGSTAVDPIAAPQFAEQFTLAL